MTRARLQALLSSALFAALAPACGGSVAFELPPEAEDTGTRSDTAVLTDTGIVFTDTGTRPDSKPPLDTAPPIDTGSCTPIPENTSCNEKVTYPCGVPFEPASPPTQDECRSLCAPIAWSYGPPSYYYCHVAKTDDGSAIVYCSGCAVGRKPADLLGGEDACASEDPIGTALAEMARIEAASVHAFRRLERSLTGLNADPSLRARARRAARDEVAHARSAARLAKKRGARPRPVRLAETKAPTTFELALENAVEGCVHETLGVAYLEHQRMHATDPELRAHAATIYDDELDHAALSWDLLPFFDRHLSDAERSELRRATSRALDEVVAEMGRIHPRVRETLGLPPQPIVARMVGTLRETLFAA